ncbi:MAG: hypothetical protein SP1CHLAM54_11770 [Chlamydiia bacterium]|nr:hypothetical protein [Chlamydiia bacterium]MCH9616078.1 hypothetical protein [Chlamydiia bacterium]MCH9629101.1 hypothetical protein [Chlamydiia bacterium]
MNQKVGRNDPCPCGSGKKYKKCCEKKSYLQRKTATVLTSSKTADKVAKAAQGAKMGSLFNKIVAPTTPSEPKSLKEKSVSLGKVEKKPGPS